MGLRFLGAAAAVAVLGWAGAASAVTIIEAAPPGNLAERVFSTGSQSGTTFTGVTSANSTISGLTVDVTSPQTLTDNGSGFSNITCPSGGCSSFTLAPTNFTGFQDVSFFLQNASGVNTGTFDVTVNYVGGGSDTLTANLTSSNQYEIVAGAGQTISSIEIMSPSGGNFTQLKQIEFTTAGATGVPEPAVWSMMLAGAGLLGGALRRRRREAVA